MYESVAVSPVGPLKLISTDEALLAVIPEDSAPLCTPRDEIGRRTAEQLEQYFAGTRREFELPLAPRGTEFQRLVWHALTEIPYGETRTYGEIAEMIGRPTAARAVGGAVGANPILIIVPCHRILAANGIGGFSCGLWRKKILLEQEEIVF